MARFADVRRANRHAVQQATGTGTTTRKLTLYGQGIHEGTLHVPAGTAVYYENDVAGTRYHVWLTDDDYAVTYATSAPKDAVA